MAPLRSNDRVFEDASGLRAHYDGIRARLRSGTSAPAKPPPHPVAAAPTAPPGPHDIPLDIRDVVASVAAALGIAPLAMLADLAPTASLGRRAAAALVVRRSLLPVPAVAALFGIAEVVVAGGLVTLDAVLAFTQASAIHTPLDPLVRRVIAEWERFEDRALRVPISEIQEIVARVFSVSVTDMKSARRGAAIVRPRHVAMYLAKRFTLRSLPEIAGAFGGRDHTTVVHAVRKIAAYGDAVALRIGASAGVEDFARALRDELR